MKEDTIEYSLTPSGNDNPLIEETVLDSNEQPMKQEAHYKSRSKVISILIASVIGFAVVSYWRGVWVLWDQLVFPDDKIISATLSLITGIAILTILKTFFSVLAPPIPIVNIHLDSTKK